MAERLDNLNYVVKPEIIEKVLKRMALVAQLRFTIPCCPLQEKQKSLGWSKTYCRKWSTILLTRTFVHGPFSYPSMGKAKRISEALLAFKNMIKSGCEPDGIAYKATISSLCTAGNGELVLESYKDMVDKDMVLDIGVYKMLINCMARLGDITIVHMVGNDMIRLSLLSESKVHDCVLKSFCNFGKIKEALELIHELKNKDFTLELEYVKTLVRRPALYYIDKNIKKMSICLMKK